jgi:hypothetical protein
MAATLVDSMAPGQVIATDVAVEAVDSAKKVVQIRQPRDRRVAPMAT